MVLLKGYLLRPDTNVGRSFQFNPVQLMEGIDADWEEGTALAASYKRLSFTVTGNLEIPLELIYDRLLLEEQLQEEGIYTPELAKKYMHDVRSFLMSLMYPRRSKGSIFTQSPPSVLFIWPNMISIRAIVSSLKITSKEFDEEDLSVTLMNAALTLKEQRYYPIYSDEIEKVGSLRTKIAQKT